mmetsp:Transcript_15262/g.15139  ORF Transcript_15262/g.15139 Transcript_15262/m.15139 type:complete len:192 (+) Transcript_15262:1-576(+)
MISKNLFQKPLANKGLLSIYAKRPIIGWFKKKETLPQKKPGKELPVKAEVVKKIVSKNKVQEVSMNVTPIPVKDDNIFGEISFQISAKEREKNMHEFLHPDLLALDNVTLQKFNPKELKRGLDEGERPFPVTPRIAAYEIKEPIVGAKQYRWCSCGMSRSQPLCDGSHRGSKFKPLKFRIEQQVDTIHLCG